jgi:pimeloyl-ACP methyl ester carboxylesterase
MDDSVQHPIRRWLRANSIFSALSGAVVLATAAQLPLFLGVGGRVSYVVLGLGLVLYGMHLIIAALAVGQWGAARSIGSRRVASGVLGILVVAGGAVDGQVPPMEPSLPSIETLRVLPFRSVDSIDRMLASLEKAYAEKDVEAFVAHYAEDFQQVDVNRRIHVSGKDAWRAQTVQVNQAHQTMGRIHHGRALIGDWLVVELEWFGTVVGTALGRPGEEHSYRYSGLGLLQVEDGRIRRQILFGDVVSLEEQLGLRPHSTAQQTEQSVPDEGRLVDVGGHRLFIRCQGEGSPTVVFEAGLGAWSLAWLQVQEAVSSTTRACVYDRAGYGSSDPGPRPRDARSIAADLHRLLSATERPPFVLVGHSFGGWIARVYASLHPDQVAGLALVESAHEEQWQRLPPVIRQLLDASLSEIEARADSARQGLLRAEAVPRHTVFGGDQSLWAAYVREMLDASHHDAQAGEMRAMDESARQVQTGRRLADLPLGVLSSAREFDQYRGTPIPVEEANQIWLELQDELAALSSNVVHIVTMTGPHTVQYEEPHIVVGLIAELVRRVREPSPAP